MLKVKLKKMGGSYIFVVPMGIVKLLNFDEHTELGLELKNNHIVVTECSKKTEDEA